MIIYDIDTPCAECAYCIEDDCLLNYKGSYDKNDKTATNVSDVTACKNFLTIED